MERTISINEIDVKLDNNANWFFVYKNQFGHDIVPTLIPMLATMIDIVSGLVNETGKTDDVEFRDIIAIADSDAMMNALVHLSSLEFVDLINIFWAMAKNADESIPEPSRWIRQFDVFPVDEIVPIIFDMIVSGVTSSKNSERVRKMMANLKPRPDTK